MDHTGCYSTSHGPTLQESDQTAGRLLPWTAQLPKWWLFRRVFEHCPIERTVTRKKNHNWEVEKVKIMSGNKEIKWKVEEIEMLIWKNIWNVQGHSDVKARDQKLRILNALESLHFCRQASNANARIMMWEQFQHWISENKMWQMYWSCTYSMLMYIVCVMPKKVEAYLRQAIFCWKSQLQKMMRPQDTLHTHTGSNRTVQSPHYNSDKSW